jgi:hypothetical protein
MADGGSIDERLAPRDFVTDFVWAVRSVFDQPSVAFVSIALWVLPTVVPWPRHGAPSGIWWAVTLLVALFYFGWCGAERTFFLRRREGTDIALTDLLWSAVGFTGRFLRLGALMAIVVVPASVIARNVFGAHSPAATRIGTMIIMVPVDLLLTFVTSALVFTTRSARRALRIGVAMIWQTWPRSGLYVVCPALALNMLNAIYPTDIRVVRVVTTAALALLALLAKGATAAFYLRERPASREIVDETL